MPITDPTWIFFVTLGVILLAPLVMERLRIPSIVGMIFAGILIGPNGFDVLEYDSSFELFGKVGLYYIMFLASLEMNLQNVKKNRGQALSFGLITFIIPVALGLVANSLLPGYTFMAALLMAAMYASHTLISYPIVMRFGLSKLRSVNIAVGGTIIADTLTLLILAVIGGFSKGEMTGMTGLMLMLKLLAISLAIIIVFPRLARWFFRRHDDGIVQFIFVLVLVFLGAGLMQFVGMEGILGAFLVGIVLNKTIPTSSPLMAHIEFVGNALFIRYFLIGVGMIINLRAFFTSMNGLYVAIVMIAVATLGKWLAAFAAQKLYDFSAHGRRLVFGLTSSRAAATLAIVLVGAKIKNPDGTPLFDADVVNATMVLILFSCVLSTFVTERSAKKLMKKYALTEDDDTQKKHTHVLLSIQYDEDVADLTHVALMLRKSRSDDRISAISVVATEDPELRQNAQKRLQMASKIAAEANVEIYTQCRLSVNPVTGISYCAKEIDATDILIGLHHKTKITDYKFLGKFATDLINTVRQQVVIYRSVMPLNIIRRIHVVVPRGAEFEPGFLIWARRVATLVKELSCRLDVYGTPSLHDTLKNVWKDKNFEAEYIDFTPYDDFQPIANRMRQDHLLIVIAARQGMPSAQQNYLSQLPEQIERYCSARSLMIVYPTN